jgi:site-specific DNA-cytosine methylase
MFAQDIDPDAVAIHTGAFEACQLGDVGDIDPVALPKHDVLVAGFPCQPFSTSGSRTGFAHSHGNVFEHLARIVELRTPPFLMLENVEGLLVSQHGYSMARILKRLCELGYGVEWAILDAVLFGAPQTRRRVVMVAVQQDFWRTKMHYSRELSWDEFWLRRPIFSRVFRTLNVRKGQDREGRLSEVVRDREPAIGKKKPPSGLFRAWGTAFSDQFVTSPIQYDLPDRSEELGEICCPNFAVRSSVRSVRYYARRGPTLPCVRTVPVAHCLGTNIGAAPTFAVPNRLVSGTNRQAILEHANWSRQEDGHLMFRLTPERALHLFGSHIGRIQSAFRVSKVPMTKKYILLGNMVAPAVSAIAALAIESVISDRRRELIFPIQTALTYSA